MRRCLFSLLTPRELPVFLVLCGILLVVAQAPAADDDDMVRIGLIAGVHRYAKDGNLERLKELLDDHPELVNAIYKPLEPTKPSWTDGFTPLHYAAQNGHEKVVAYLIDKGADCNYADSGGWTPLHAAADRGRLAVVKLLVKYGAKPGAKTKPVPEFFGILPSSPPGAMPVKIPAVPARTALDVASERKHAEVVEYLKTLKK
jgi:ankyrin repeat protein